MITDYASLQQAIADWLARADLGGQIPTFIQLAEARLSRDLRVADMQATVTGTANPDMTVVLPTDAREVQSFRIALSGGRYKELPPLPPARLADVAVTTGYPIGYVTVASTLQLIGGTTAPDYALTYWQQIPALATAATGTNWLLTREPGLYLYAALLEASPYIKDLESVQAWVSQYQALRAGVQAEDDRARYGNAPAIGAPLRNVS